ncbi:hypothetical protein IX317_001227 [Fusobacterium sp. DD29]|uniref:META domain-containing protein n=1 Tax=unclassified Fusobacterium TaxID=2648384 RepID=UPI001B8C93D7|nr:MULTISPECIES: META domain-containing protein [unclassified Fusobacterium]MBR8701340.1 hypothetical protein [Fusobacterium sp. DD45]MBR8711108.1 hypothetical protein [Fusobacterium sp. DD28]MBR8749553.1 hypothetical protein [Fusobacterium sp. DD29]MBR8752274.1 hypothetical protein [Fusobacterium sp. DD26]MBR8761809.1 hypothetical protein [Fusobacterium sp. DD25]
MKKILILASMVFLFASCTELQVASKKQEPKSVTLAEIDKNDYVLTNLYPEKGMTLGFDAQGRIFGYSGLNRFFGKATVFNGNIKIENLATTRMSGPRDAMIAEAQYLAMLNDMTKISFDKDKLVLSNEKGEILIYTIKK